MFLSIPASYGHVCFLGGPVFCSAVGMFLGKAHPPAAGVSAQVVSFLPWHPNGVVTSKLWSRISAAMRRRGFACVADLGWLV